MTQSIMPIFYRTNLLTQINPCFKGEEVDKRQEEVMQLIQNDKKNRNSKNI